MAIKTLSGLHPTRVTTVIAELIEQEFLNKYSLNGKQVYQNLPKACKPNLSRYETQETVKLQELRQITHYGEQSDQCRMVILRHALGDDQAKECLRCDCCLKRTQAGPEINAKIPFITSWLSKRPVPIASIVKEKVSEGLSVLDSKMRSPLFSSFMKQRNSCPEGTLGMDDELLKLMKHHLSILMKKEQVLGIVLIPYRTWQSRRSRQGTRR